MTCALILKSQGKRMNAFKLCCWQEPVQERPEINVKPIRLFVFVLPAERLFLFCFCSEWHHPHTSQVDCAAPVLIQSHVMAIARVLVPVTPNTG
jgi:hypothetical protein